MHIFDISIFGIHIAPTWYGLMYALGFMFCYSFVKKYGKIKIGELDTLLFYIFLGVIGGGRIGYVVLYNLDFFIDNPGDIFAMWKGGMSFHGGFLGVLIATFMFGKKYNYSFFSITDILAICLPVALGLGRIGNWINNELPGYTGYTGMFSMHIHGVSYFPNPLLQALLEGVILTSIMIFVWKFKTHTHRGFLSGVFLIGYGTLRLIAEVFRLPDIQIGYLFGTTWITLGMIYTLPMILVGGIIIRLGQHRREDTR